ncbi:hypothetical protein MY10362_000304 [Beauveria mimosiformis]
MTFTPEDLSAAEENITKWNTNDARIYDGNGKMIYWRNATISDADGQKSYHEKRGKGLLKEGEALYIYGGETYQET